MLTHQKVNLTLEVENSNSDEFLKLMYIDIVS